MATKTYILAPNFSYKPDGPVQIGSIIADPFQPAKSLSNVATTPAVETVLHHNLEAVCDTGRSVKLSLWANILDAAGAGVGASRSRNAVTSLYADRLETRYLANEPVDNDPELISRLQERRVQAAINSGLYSRAPVYLISGVKIASGLIVRTERGRTLGGSLTATAPAAQAVGIDVGASVERELRRGTSSSFDAGDEDILVAYQLHVIRTKQRSKGGVVADVFESNAAFLHDGKNDEEVNIEVRTGDFTALAQAAQEMDIVIGAEKTTRLDGGGLTCIQVVEE